MKIIENIESRTILSTLWIFVTLNYLYCDLIGLMDANMLRQYLTGSVEGLVLNEKNLMVAGVLMEIPIAMILLSGILIYKYNRLANIMAGFIKTSVMILTLTIGKVTVYYLFFAIIEILTTTFIVWYSWHWKEKKLNRSTSYL